MTTIISVHGQARFHIKRQIADTLQGRIYSAIDLLTNQPVVIKEAWRSLVHSGRSRSGHRVPENFLKEREMGMYLTDLSNRSPQNDITGFAKTLVQWDDEQSYYYAMEFCAEELFDYINKSQALEKEFTRSESTKPQIPMRAPNPWVRNVIIMFAQICKTVQWLHHKGYCHLDLSLENVMISDVKSLKLKLIDFGLAQKFTNGFQFKGRIGKPQYMCPEAYARGTYDARSADVWCLGVMLFMMLIGAPPYQAPRPQSAAFKFLVSGRIRDVLSHWKRLRLVTEDALDLLDKIFKYQKQRISLDEVIRHPFLKSDDDEDVISVLSAMSCDDTVLSFETPAMNKDQQSNKDQRSAPVSPTIRSFQSNEDDADECDKMLDEWGLREISGLLHDSGWSVPSQWPQLTLAVLKYEIGLSHDQATVFLEKQNPKPDPTMPQDRRRRTITHTPSPQHETAVPVPVHFDGHNINLITEEGSPTLMGITDDRTRVDESNKNTEPQAPPTTRTSGAGSHDSNTIHIMNHDSPLCDTIVENTTNNTTDELNKQTDAKSPKASCSNIIIPTHTNADAGDAKTVEDLCTDTPLSRFTVDEERREIVDELEAVLDKQIANLASAYEQFQCFKQEFLGDTNNGIVSCPTHSNNGQNGDYNVSNTTEHNPPNKHHSNRENNRSNDGHDGHNDGNDKEDDEYKECKSSTPCNHLTKCMECSYVLTQRSAQIKLFKSLVSTLQKQHEYHTSFENMMCSAMQHPKYTGRSRKSKAKVSKALKEEPTSPFKASYNPSYRGKGNVRISRDLTRNIIPKTIQQPISNVFAYLDRSIGLQYNDGQLLRRDFDRTPSTHDLLITHSLTHTVTHALQVLNFDFTDKQSNEPLYCVMERLSSNQKSSCQWKMHDRLYTSAQLSSLPLPVSSRLALTHQGRRDIGQYTFNSQNVQSIVQRSTWNVTPVFNQKNNKKRITLSITKEQLNPLIAKALLAFERRMTKLIPILMFGADSHWIEYVLMVRIDRDIGDIGVSLRYDKDTHEVRITGIHLDKQMIHEQHELLDPHHECHCLDGYQLSIHDIHVGNPDDLVNQVKDYKGRYNAFKQLIYKFVNGKDTERYEILQKHAQVLIQHDNGSLGGWSVLPSPSTPSMKSISSSPIASSVSSMNNVISYDSESPSNDSSFFQ
eukprot:191413_1